MFEGSAAVAAAPLAHLPSRRDLFSAPVPVPVSVPEKASNEEAGGTDRKVWSSITNGSTSITWHWTFWSWPTASSRHCRAAAAPCRPAQASIDLDRAQHIRRRGQALEARQETLLPDGARVSTESVALLDVCIRLELIDQPRHQAGKDMIVRVVSMLIRLAQACEE
jgi:hypothetical protein